MLAFAPIRVGIGARHFGIGFVHLAVEVKEKETYALSPRDARAFAARVVKEGGHDPAERITWAWRQALGRAPRADELQVMAALLAKHLALYANDAAGAEQLVKTGLAPAPTGAKASELAAWTNVARVILNLHQTITRM